MQNDPIIVEADLTSIDAIVRLHRKANLGRYDFPKTVFDARGIDSLLKQVVLSRDRKNLIRYISDKEICGFYWLKEINNAECHLNYISVAPSHQKRGLGNMLLEDIIYQASKQYKLLSLNVDMRNDGALNLYKRHGFCQIKRTHIFKNINKMASNGLCGKWKLKDLEKSNDKYKKFGASYIKVQKNQEIRTLGWIEGDVVIKIDDYESSMEIYNLICALDGVSRIYIMCEREMPLMKVGSILRCEKILR